MKLTARLVAGLLLLVSLPMVARPLTPEDVLSIRDLSDLRIAPNGERVAFVVTEPADAAKPREPRRKTIWLVATSGEEAPQPIDAASKNDFSPRWSPDGQTIAFLSDRSLEGDTSTQIYLYRLGGMTARRLTSIAGGVEQFQWSPDGTSLSFIARDQPSAEQRRKEAAGFDAEESDAPMLYAQLWIVNVSDGAAAQITREDVEVVEAAWSPNGRELALMLAPDPTPEASSKTWVVVVDRATGKIARTLSEHAAFPGGMRWSPDGKLLTFYDAAHTSPFATWISVVSAAGGAVQPILKEYRGTVLGIDWMPDSKQFVVQSIEGTGHVLLSIDATTGERRRVVDFIASQWDASFSTNGTTTVYLAQSATAPSDIWLKRGDAAPRRITDFNPHTRTWTLGAVSEMTWTNTKDGLLRRGIVITPPGYQSGRRYPTVVIGHPGDTSWWPGFLVKSWSWGQLLATNGYVAFMPNYRGVNGEGAEMHANIGDWGVALQDLEDGVDALIARGIADPERLGIGGWSNGGYMTAWTISQTPRYKAAIAQAAHTDLFSIYGTSYLRGGLRITVGDPYLDRAAYDARSPIAFARNIRTPTLIIHGVNDRGVPLGQAQELHTALKSFGVPVRLVVYPREGHTIREYTHQIDLQRRMLDWFDRYLRR
jgi:dipeptidyl aminopeptidase/acylaminoacyl peptidase